MNEQREMTPPRTTLVLQSVQFSASSSTGCSACYSCPRQSPGSSHLPAPQMLRVLQLYYTVASSQLLAARIAPRTKSCSTMSPVLRFQLYRLLRVQTLYSKVASSQPPPRQITPRTKVVLESRQFSPSSSTDTPRSKVVLQSRQFSSSSSPDTPCTKVVLRSRQFSASSCTDCSAY